MSTFTALEERLIDCIRRARRDIEVIGLRLHLDGSMAASRRLTELAAKLDDELKDAEAVQERALDDLAMIARASMVYD